MSFFKNKNFFIVDFSIDINSIENPENFLITDIPYSELERRGIERISINTLEHICTITLMRIHT